MERTDTRQIWDSGVVRIALQQEFLKRRKKNPAYSLRAYATFLGVNQSFLSKIFHGQRRVTPQFAESIAPRIGLRPLPPQAVPTLHGFSNIPEEEFQLISGWVHFALLELMKTKNFNPEPRAIAHRLGLHPTEVQDAIERLERLRYISRSGKKWRLLSPNHSWSNLRETTEARRQLQRTLLQKGLDALDHIPFAERENASLTVAVNKERLPEMKEKLKEMRAELAEFFQPAGKQNLNEVFQLVIAFFPVSKDQNQEAENE